MVVSKEDAQKVFNHGIQKTRKPKEDDIKAKVSARGQKPPQLGLVGILDLDFHPPQL